jgi:hypothetical protein
VEKTDKAERISGVRIRRDFGEMIIEVVAIVAGRVRIRKKTDVVTRDNAGTGEDKQGSQIYDEGET